MILDDKKSVLDYKGKIYGIGLTMKNLALEAYEKSSIEDPIQSEIAGKAMVKIHQGKELDEQEKIMTKTVMMAVYHPVILDYISKQFEDANTKG